MTRHFERATPVSSDRANHPQSFMGQHGQALADRGYGIIPIQPNAKKPGLRRGRIWFDFPGWADRCGRPTSELELGRWLGWDDAGIGLVCGAIVCIDIDVLDQEVALKIEALAKRLLGDTPLLRIGRAPKRALIYRAVEPFRGFKKHPIEVHCLGQQVVAYGVHPDTGTEYQWPDGHPVDVEILDLPAIDEGLAREFIERAFAIVPESLRPAVLAFKTDATPKLEGKRTEGGTIDGVAAALEFIANDNLAYDDWLRIGQSIKAGLGEEGRALFEAWSAKSSKNDYATTVRTWRGLNPKQITVGTIYRLAHDAGWSPPFDLNLHADYDPRAVHPAQAFFDQPRTRIKGDVALARTDAAPRQTFKPMPQGWNNVGGVLEEMMRLMVDTAYRPQPELALAASLAAVGALMGRRYRAENGTRPNVYVVGIGKSGSGKNHARNVIDRLFAKAGLDRYLGASRIASGAGLIKALTAQPSQLYRLDEFGVFLQGITDRKRAPRYLTEIGDLFLELYTTSDGTYRGIDFAGGGPTERKREPIVNPSLSIYGTTTSGHLWEALGAASREDGSLARYLIFGTSCDYPPENPLGGNIECPPDLVERLARIAQGEAGAEGNLSDAELASVPPPCTTVRLSEAARSRFAELGSGITDQLNSAAAAGHESILARIKENASKLALIRAVSRNWLNPYIEIHDAQWAILIARHCADLLVQESDERISENVVESNHKRVLRLIKEAGPGGIRLGVLSRKTQWLDGRILHDVIRRLQGSDLIEVEIVPTGTKPYQLIKAMNSMS